jgi:glutathione S-transferase
MRAQEIPFEETLTPFAEDSNWEAYRRFSPSGRVPCLHDSGRVVWDSLAIAEYLAERHPGVWPLDPDARAWARCAACEMHSGFAELRERCSMTCGQRVALHEVGEGLAADLSRLDEIWSEGLKRFGGPWLAADTFGAVDAFYAPVAFRMQTYGLTLSDAAQTYSNRLLEHPAMREWYAAALAEPWREQAHESGISAAGRISADFRLPPAD